MCLYPRLIQNPKYKPNKKNGGIVPHMIDKRVGLVAIGCNMCMECMRKKSNEWRLRLLEDIKEFKNGKFVTLTFNTNSYKKLFNETDGHGYTKDNNIATLAVRRWLERIRKETKKSVRHWLITELGHGQFEHIHIHGIIYTDDIHKICDKWGYGYTWKGYDKYQQINGQWHYIHENYVNEKTINYLMKYVTKADFQHRFYKPKILCSAGIGRNYIKTFNSTRHKFKGEETNTLYKDRAGYEMALPIYWRNKLYTEEEREKLWLYQLDKNVRYVGGEKIKVTMDNENYLKTLEWYRRINNEMGYNRPDNWSLKEYENRLREIKQWKRINYIRN